MNKNAPMPSDTTPTPRDTSAAMSFTRTELTSPSAQAGAHVAAKSSRSFFPTTPSAVNATNPATPTPPSTYATTGGGGGGTSGGGGGASAVNVTESRRSL